MCRDSTLRELYIVMIEEIVRLQLGGGAGDNVIYKLKRSSLE